MTLRGKQRSMDQEILAAVAVREGSLEKGELMQLSTPPITSQEELSTNV